MDLIPVQFDGCRFVGLSAEFQAGLPLQVWQGIGQKLIRVSSYWRWWLGDWLNFGEANYGEKYQHALRVIDLDYGSLRNVAWVAKAFELSRRRDNLSWSHHQEAVHLEVAVQERFLAEASAKEWTRQQLREAIYEYEHGEARKAGKAVSFVPSVWALQGKRWLQTQLDKEPVQAWPVERRRAVAGELRPFVEIYTQLMEGL